uniref:Transcriptional repressor TUP1 n=1 Tax=Ganoderma boninense TaxID=34458 RepID=A0A5K1K6P7_9APHY|nr:Transcriptional repressor TUP1 [Ganoderma boninense]
MSAMATTSSQPDAAHYANSGHSISSASDSDSSSLTASGQTSIPSGPHDDPSVAHPDPGKPLVPCKEPMRDFKWGGNLVRKALPVGTIPRWLDPSRVDVAEPTKLPLCWYGVPFERDLIYPYLARIGLASYYKRELLRAKPGDLDVFRTWANMEKWFKRLSGIKLDLNLVWGHPTPILTFFSNHELLRITQAQVYRIDDLLEDIGYDRDCELMWYLDRNLSY